MWHIRCDFWSLYDFRPTPSPKQKDAKSVMVVSSLNLAGEHIEVFERDEAKFCAGLAVSEGGS